MSIESIYNDLKSLVQGLADKIEELTGHTVEPTNTPTPPDAPVVDNPTGNQIQD